MGALIFAGCLGDTLRAKGEHEEAGTILSEAVVGAVEALGAEHKETLLIKGKAARLALAVSGDRRAVVGEGGGSGGGGEGCG